MDAERLAAIRERVARHGADLAPEDGIEAANAISDLKHLLALVESQQAEIERLRDQLTEIRAML